MSTEQPLHTLWEELDENDEFWLQALARTSPSGAERPARDRPPAPSLPEPRAAAGGRGRHWPAAAVVAAAAAVIIVGLTLADTPTILDADQTPADQLEQPTAGKRPPATQAPEQDGLADDASESPYNRGVRLGGEGRYEEAVAAYDRAIELDPTNVAAHYNRGGILNELNRHDEALAAYDRAIELDPDNDAAHYNRGGVLNELNRHDEALAAYDRVLELDPDNDAARYNRELILIELDQDD